MEKSKTSNRYAAEVGSRAVRLVLEHGADRASRGRSGQGSARQAGGMPRRGRLARSRGRLAARRRRCAAGCGGRNVIKVCGLVRPAMSARIKTLEREVREVRQASEIVRKASA